MPMGDIPAGVYVSKPDYEALKKELFRMTELAKNWKDTEEWLADRQESIRTINEQRAQLARLNEKDRNQLLEIKRLKIKCGEV